MAVKVKRWMRPDSKKKKPAPKESDQETESDEYEEEEEEEAKEPAQKKRERKEEPAVVSKPPEKKQKRQRTSLFNPINLKRFREDGLPIPFCPCGTLAEFECQQSIDAAGAADLPDTHIHRVCGDCAALGDLEGRCPLCVDSVNK